MKINPKAKLNTKQVKDKREAKGMGDSLNQSVQKEVKKNWDQRWDASVRNAKVMKQLDAQRARKSAAEKKARDIASTKAKSTGKAQRQK